MSRPTEDLRRRLLTRSDLARLKIPASKVLSWLSRGALDLVGNYNTSGCPEDPVFAVLAADVRQELAAGLQALGRDRVVFAPLRARSLLLRALLAERGIAVPAEIDNVLVADPAAVDRAGEVTLAQQLLASGLEQVLTAADDLEQEVASVLGLARRESADGAETPPAPEGVGETSPTAPTARCQGASEPTSSATNGATAKPEPIDPLPEAPALARPQEHEFEHPLLESLSTGASGLAAGDAADAVEGHPDEDADGNSTDWFDSAEPFGTTAEWGSEPAVPGLEPIPPAEDDRALVAARSCDTGVAAPFITPPVPDRATACPATSLAQTMTEERNDSAATTAAEPFQETAVAVLDELLEGVADAGPDAGGSVTATQPDFLADSPGIADAGVPPPGTADDTPSAATAPKPDAGVVSAVIAEPAVAADAASATEPEAPVDTTPHAEATPTPPVAGAPADEAGVRPASTTDHGQQSTWDLAPPTTLPPTPPPIVNQVVVDMTPVERVISGLRGALEELAHRPSPSLDVQPLVAALDKSTERASSQDQSTKATQAALQAVATELRTFGERVEKNGAATLQAIAAIQAENGTASHEPTPFVVARQSRTPFALLAIGFLLACWAAVFWFKTGNPKLALGTLVAGNLVGCCLLACRRD